MSGTVRDIAKPTKFRDYLYYQGSQQNIFEHFRIFYFLLNLEKKLRNFKWNKSALISETVSNRVKLTNFGDYLYCHDYSNTFLNISKNSNINFHLSQKRLGIEQNHRIIVNNYSKINLEHFDNFILIFFWNFLKNINFHLSQKRLETEQNRQKLGSLIFKKKSKFPKTTFYICLFV